MRKTLFGYLVILLAVPLTAGTCSDNGGDDGDSGTDQIVDTDCFAASCTNDDHNTHTDCDCEANYCFPAINAAAHAHLPDLTCTKSNCELGDSSSCPIGYDCFGIPSSIIKYAADEYGAILPPTVCGLEDWE